MKAGVWVAGLLFLGAWHWGPDYWWSKWAVTLWLASAALGYQVARRWTLSAGVAVGFTLLSAISVFAWRDNYVAGLDKVTATSIDAVTAATAVAFLLVVLLFVFLEARDLLRVRRALAVICVADAVWTITQGVAGGLSPLSVGGFFDQHSINGCFLAVTLPFVLEFVSGRGAPAGAMVFVVGIVVLALILVCFFGGTRSPFAVLPAVVFGIARPRGRRRLTLALWLLVWAYALLVVCSRFDLSHVFYSSERFPAWRVFFLWFFQKEWLYWVHGFGNGTFFVLGPAIQRLSHYADYNGNWWTWMHSDWGQLFFEEGAIGVALFAWLAIDAWRFSRGDRAVRGALAGLIVTAVFQYPVHLPLFAFTAAAITALALEASPRREGQGRTAPGERSGRAPRASPMGL